LSAPLRIWLYFTQKDFIRDGGAAGGNFSLEKGGIQLVLSRLFEGYNGKTPGVAPFLHEFGHLLDHFDAAQGRLSNSHGTLPGMRPDEGTIYSPKARELFMKGKALEMERYAYLQERDYSDDTPLPIGHPYVFQNNTEFIAGYFEMFFRNPHYFAEQNPDLYDSFVLTFGQDPRKVWIEDFPFYIQQNQGFYQGGQRPPRHGLTI
jgi:Mlc titration factor MtfA (ptsG expression regulator)